MIDPIECRACSIILIRLFSLMLRKSLWQTSRREPAELVQPSIIRGFATGGSIPSAYPHIITTAPEGVNLPIISRFTASGAELSSLCGSEGSGEACTLG